MNVLVCGVLVDPEILISGLLGKNKQKNLIPVNKLEKETPENQLYYSVIDSL